MKKILSLFMTVIMVLSCMAIMSSCGSSDDAKSNGDELLSTKAETTTKSVSDFEYVKENGTLVVGITDFEPMDYKDKSGNWIGFDADMATAFAESLGVKVKFVEIDWDNKVMELDGKMIDCVWNGMTLTDEVTSAMSCTNAYCNNQQIVIVQKDKADKYKTIEDCKNLSFAVEKGSAGKAVAEENGFKFVEVDKQASALMEVSAGTSDAAIIDSLMAAAMVGEGTSYENLTYTVGLSNEEYGVGFRKGSDLTEKLNDFFAECKENGKLQETAEKYGVQAALVK